jgi:hypothetical protein
MTNQILDFGLPAPIDLQVIGHDPGNYRAGGEAGEADRSDSGGGGCAPSPEVNYPTMQINADRTKARQVGLTQADVANSTLISLAGSGQTTPDYWLNPKTQVNYQIVTQTPIYRIDSLQALARTPITSPNGNTTQLLGNVAAFRRDLSPIIADHYNIQPVYDVYADVDQRDLGGVASEIQKIMDQAKKGSAEDDADLAARRGADDERIVPAAGDWHHFRDHAGVFADGGELPIVAGSADYSDGDSVRVLRDFVDAVPDADDVQRAFVDGRDYDDWCGDGELDFDGGVCE